MTTPEDYISDLEEPRRSEISELDTLIREHAPGLEPKMWGEIIGYGEYHYKYDSGREGDAAIIGLSSRARYISLYVNVGVAEKHRDKLPNADIGKSCIRFKRLEEVDQDVLADVIEQTAKAGKVC